MTISAQFMIPRGLIMIAPLTNGVVASAHRPLVEVRNATYALESELEPYYSNQDCGPVVAFRDPIGAQPVIEADVLAWDAKNIALAISGDDSAVSTTTAQHTVAGAIAAGEYAVMPHKGLSSLSITDDSIALVKDTDYTEYDMPGGVIKFLTAQTGSVVFDYTFADYTKIEIGGAEADEYELVLIAKNRAGDCSRQTVRFWSCSVLQSGVMEMLAPYDDNDPKAISLRFLANWNQTKKDAGESGYGEVQQ